VQPCDGRACVEGFEGVVSGAVELARCYACGEEKPVHEFYPDSSKAAGRMSRCRACDLEKCRRYYAANRERVLARHKTPPPRGGVRELRRDVHRDERQPALLQARLSPDRRHGRQGHRAVRVVRQGV
jgi:hypothetical protein